MDWIKALLIGVVLACGILAIPLILAVLLPILAFVAIIVVIWFLLQVIKHDGDDKKPP